MSLVEKIKQIITKLNSQGIPMPVLRDPATGKPSVTLTLVFLSFNTALIGQVGKISKLLDGIDLSQSNYLFLICLGGYLGRRLQTNGSTKSVDIGPLDKL